MPNRIIKYQKVAKVLCQNIYGGFELYDFQTNQSEAYPICGYVS